MTTPRHSTPLTVRVPAPLLERVEARSAFTGISRHGTLLALIASGLDHADHQTPALKERNR